MSQENCNTAQDAPETPGGILHYTLDGTAPTSSSAVCTVPLLLQYSATVSAISIAPHDLPSAVAIAKYFIAVSPAVHTEPASALTTTTATIRALVKPFGVAGMYDFQFGTNSVNPTGMTATMTLPATSNAATMNANLTGLTTKTTYSYRAVVTTVGGTSSSAIFSFTTN